MTLFVFWMKLWTCLQSGTTLDSSLKWGSDNWIISQHNSLLPNTSSEKCLRLGWPIVIIPAGRLSLVLSGVELLEQLSWLMLWRQSTTRWRTQIWTQLYLPLTASLQLRSPLLNQYPSLHSQLSQSKKRCKRVHVSETVIFAFNKALKDVFLFLQVPLPPLLKDLLQTHHSFQKLPRNTLPHQYQVWQSKTFVIITTQWIAYLDMHVLDSWCCW